MYKTILVPIDILESDLTELVIPHVEFIARYEDPMIHFATVIPSYKFHAVFGLTYSIKMPSPKDMKEATMKELEALTNKFKLPDDRIKHHVLMGSPREQILKLSDSIESDLIIVGSRRPGVSTFLLGSTAAAIVGYARTPVMVIR